MCTIHKQTPLQYWTLHLALSVGHASCSPSGVSITVHGSFRDTSVSHAALFCHLVQWQPVQSAYRSCSSWRQFLLFFWHVGIFRPLNHATWCNSRRINEKCLLFFYLFWFLSLEFVQYGTHVPLLPVVVRVVHVPRVYHVSRTSTNYFFVLYIITGYYIIDLIL